MYNVKTFINYPLSLILVLLLYILEKKRLYFSSSNCNAIELKCRLQATDNSTCDNPTIMQPIKSSLNVNRVCCKHLKTDSLVFIKP